MDEKYIKAIDEMTKDVNKLWKQKVEEALRCGALSEETKKEPYLVVKLVWNCFADDIYAPLDDSTKRELAKLSYSI